MITQFSVLTFQGWKFAHLLIALLLIAHSLICSFRSNQMSNCEGFAQIARDKWVTVSESLRLLKTNEQPWANHSGRSWQLSNRERFAQVAQRKWMIVSKSNRLLTKNEWMRELFVFLSESLIRSFFCKKRAIRSENRWAKSQPCNFSSACRGPCSVA